MISGFKTKTMIHSQLMEWDNWCIRYNQNYLYITSITCILNFGLQNSERKKKKKFHTDLLEFRFAKFNRHLEFVQFFISLYRLKNENSYRLHYALKHKISTVFRANTQTCSHKNATSFQLKWVCIRRNKIINKHTFQRLFLCNNVKQ